MRKKILTLTLFLVSFSWLGALFALYQLSEVSASLDEINRVSVPLARALTQVQSDAELFSREFEKKLGKINWNDTRDIPVPIPQWIGELIDSELLKMKEKIETESGLLQVLDQKVWLSWMDRALVEWKTIRAQTQSIYQKIENADRDQARLFASSVDQRLRVWRNQLDWATREYDQSLRKSFSDSEKRVSTLKTSLEFVLAISFLFSVFLILLSERTLRPLDAITNLARQISERGLLSKEVKVALPQTSLHRDDEVSQLAREFRNMATTLLEREKVVEQQKVRLQETNDLLKEMGALNHNILRSMDSAILVTDLLGRLTTCNSYAETLFSFDLSEKRSKKIVEIDQIQKISGSKLWLEDIRNQTDVKKLDRFVYQDRMMSGKVIPMKDQQEGFMGTMIILQDITEEVLMEERLREAENLASVGRMSAQIAHEVRNPLHSIGMEAEMSLDYLKSTSSSPLKSSLTSILQSVERLEKLTDNYLKLSKLSPGKKEITHLQICMENVLATYQASLEAKRVFVDWKKIGKDPALTRIDATLVEQVFGNLLQNSIQAFDEYSMDELKKIKVEIDTTHSEMIRIRFEDNGNGVSEEFQKKLFQPFATTKAQGTGLGLSFIKKVLQDHGGEVEYQNPKFFAHGACFEMKFPKERKIHAENLISG